MKKIHSYFTLLLLCQLTAFPNLLSGQAPSTRPTETIRVKWVAMSMGGTHRDLWYEGADRTEQLYVPNGGFSKAHTYSGENPMRLYRQQTTPEGEPVWQTVAEVQLPAKHSDATVFLFSDSDRQVRAVAIPGSPENTPPGTPLLINLTQYELGGFINESAFRLQPGESRRSELEITHNQVISVRLRLASNRTVAGWRRELNSTFSVAPGMQVTLLFRENRKGNVEVIPIRKMPPPPERNAASPQP